MSLGDALLSPISSLLSRSPSPQKDKDPTLYDPIAIALPNANEGNDAIVSNTEDDKKSKDDESVTLTLTEAKPNLGRRSYHGSNSNSKTSSPTNITVTSNNSTPINSNISRTSAKYTQEELDHAIKSALDAYILSKSDSKPIKTNENEILLSNESQQFKEMQQRAFDSEQALLEIGDELEAREKELQSLREKVKEEQEECLLQKTQTKALSHRLKSLEDDIENIHRKHQEQIQSLKEQNNTQLKVMELQHRHALEEKEKSYAITLESQRSVDLAARQSALQAADAALQVVKSQLDAEIAANKARESEASIQMAQAISDAKQHVYNKVKGQFEAGNKEFQKVKAQLKESQAELNTLKADKEKLVLDSNVDKTTIEKYKADVESLTARSTELQSLLLSLIACIHPLSPTPFAKDAIIPIEKIAEEVNLAKKVLI